MLIEAPELSIIVAMSKNRAIGKDNQLLWHLPEDLISFKRITIGKPLIMGRKTFESIGRPLPGRLNIVVTRQHDWQHQYLSKVRVARSLEEARQVAEAQAYIDDVEEIMVIGGEQIYRTALPAVDKIYLTRVDLDIDGDAFFPSINEDEWDEVSQKNYSSSENRACGYTFCVLKRKFSKE